MSDFYGLPTQSVGNSYLTLEFLSEAGPRLVRLFCAGVDQNLLAELPQISENTPYGTFRFFGGHRLWHAPEAFPRTYHPDHQGLTVDHDGDRVTLLAPIEPATGIQKSMELFVIPSRPEVHVNHVLTNCGVWPVELAGWAITQLPLGGVAIFPQQTQPLDPSGLLPNRHLVLWPYSRWLDPRLKLADDYIMIHADPALPPLKIGYPNRSGWVGYLNHGVLFIKRIPPYTEQSYVDHGSNCESYCNNRFIELETLSPLHKLEPGQSMNLIETWQLFPVNETPENKEEMVQLVEKIIV